MRSFHKMGLAALLLLVASGCGQPEQQNTLNGTAASNYDETTVVPGAPHGASTWVLDASASRLNFLSIKAGEIIENHHFSTISGHVSSSGEVDVQIFLDHVETRIDIRNERMRNLFFETNKHPIATINATVELKHFKKLGIGDRKQTEVAGVLSLHGAEAPITAKVAVTRLSENIVSVASTEPVIVSISDFNLDNGLEKLRTVAGLPSITSSSPVDFTFVFSAEEE